MGFLCGSRIYFIKYTTIGHRGDRIGFICVDLLGTRLLGMEMTG